MQKKVIGLLICCFSSALCSSQPNDFSVFNNTQLSSQSDSLTSNEEDSLLAHSVGFQLEGFEPNPNVQAGTILSSRRQDGHNQSMLEVIRRTEAGNHLQVTHYTQKRVPHQGHNGWLGWLVVKVVTNTIIPSG
ncbi:MAG: hypothetical protein OXE99_13425 [Cellvibrionales bacterium]|nr:hypothetical protein [Cellvibrionales bacterium]